MGFQSMLLDVVFTDANVQQLQTARWQWSLQTVLLGKVQDGWYALYLFFSSERQMQTVKDIKKEKFPIRCYEVGINKTASIQTIANFFQGDEIFSLIEDGLLILTAIFFSFVAGPPKLNTSLGQCDRNYWVYYNGDTNNNVESGVAFPTCLFINNMVLNNMKYEHVVLFCSDMGCHIDGFIAVVKVAAAYDCRIVEFVVSHQMQLIVLHGKKIVFSFSDPYNEVDDYEFGENEVYAIDIVTSTGDGKPKLLNAKDTAIHIRESARHNNRLITMPFSARSLTYIATKSIISQFPAQVVQSSVCFTAWKSWFESGSIPYAYIHCPFENKGILDDNFAGHFVAKGLDQTRGWFYTLMVLSTALFGKPAFRRHRLQILSVVVSIAAAYAATFIKFTRSKVVWQAAQIHAVNPQSVFFRGECRDTVHICSLHILQCDCVCHGVILIDSRQVLLALPSTFFFIIVLHILWNYEY
ncbi:Peptidase M24, methionine aminopeptidase [Artemisia annua]|uniref:Peptidase M24, methionine aminopeptidase n=1 Tax=Artemisia annua TaxID=35608 RepID=A0A2U1QIP7_ARTAN|nr:Peptidase M24, methionine aminopeptidase [Artemisia annua]